MIKKVPIIPIIPDYDFWIFLVVVVSLKSKGLFLLTIKFLYMFSRNNPGYWCLLCKLIRKYIREWCIRDWGKYRVLFVNMSLQWDLIQPVRSIKLNWFVNESFASEIVSRIFKILQIEAVNFILSLMVLYCLWGDADDKTKIDNFFQEYTSFFIVTWIFRRAIQLARLIVHAKKWALITKLHVLDTTRKIAFYFYYLSIT